VIDVTLERFIEIAQFWITGMMIQAFLYNVYFKDRTGMLRFGVLAAVCVTVDMMR